MNQVVQKNYLNQLAVIDVATAKLNIIKTIFFVGLSKVGKSTKFSHFFNVPLIGERKGVNTVYSLQINLNQVAAFRDGIISTTMIPNILEKPAKNGQIITCSDMAGFDDKRTYLEVLGVSYSLKKAFQTVQTCQFVFFISHDFLITAISKLYESILKFTKILGFLRLDAKQKQEFLDSIVMIITRAEPGYVAVDYASQIQELLKQINDPNYNEIRDADDKRTVVQFLNYFVRTKNISLFLKAIPNKPAPPCELYEKNLSKMPFFNLGKVRTLYRQKNKCSIIHLPFKKDFQEQLDQPQRNEFKVKCNARIKSFQSLTKILLSFFQKAIENENIFNEFIDFSSEFGKMKIYNKQFNVYPNQFKELIYEQETNLTNKFSSQDIDKKIETGINLAKTVFKLFSLFENTPTYIEQQDANKCFADWMTSFKNHIVSILTIFRDSFCKNFKEQQILLEFLFIAVRGCSEFAVIFEITEQNKNSVCSGLKDTFKSILGERKLGDIENNFVNYVCENKNTIIEEASQNEFKIYKEYIFDYKARSQQDDVIKRFIQQNSTLFNGLYELILRTSLQFCSTPEEQIYSLYGNLMEHKNKAKRDLELIQDEEDDDDDQSEHKEYPIIEENNFTFRHLLARIAALIYGLKRQGNVKNDCYAYQREEDFEGKNQSEVKKILQIEQANYAKHIFMYVGDPESAIKAYEKIIMSIDENDYDNLLTYLQGFADYCLQNCRKQRGLQLYQKCIQISLQARNRQKYNEIITKLIKIPEMVADYEKDYFLRLKQNYIINPMNDIELGEIIDEITDVFIEPYENYSQHKQVEEKIRKMSENQ